MNSQQFNRRQVVRHSASLLFGDANFSMAGLIRCFGSGGGEDSSSGAGAGWPRDERGAPGSNLAPSPTRPAWHVLQALSRGSDYAGDVTDPKPGKGAFFGVGRLGNLA